MPVYRSRTTTHGRNMAGARGLWRATGMKDEDFGKPIIAAGRQGLEPLRPQARGVAGSSRICCDDHECGARRGAGREPRRMRLSRSRQSQMAVLAGSAPPSLG